MISKIKKYMDFLKKKNPLEPKKKKTPLEIMIDEIDIRINLIDTLLIYFKWEEEPMRLDGTSFNKKPLHFIARNYTTEDNLIDGIEEGKFTFSNIKLVGGGGGPYVLLRPFGMRDSIDAIITKWIKKNPLSNFEKIIALLEENNIYSSELVYEAWELNVHGERGVFLDVDINNGFLKALIKIAWDPSIKYDDENSNFII